MTISDAFIPGQSGPGSNHNEVVLHISQSFKTGASPSDDLMTYPRYTFKASYPSAEMQ